jgi:hydrogenase 3 maturation protease
MGLALSLKTALKGASRVAVIGVGSDMRGDDAAGIEIVRRLKRRVKSPKVLLIEAGVAPENFTGSIKKFSPSHVLMIDATDFGAKAGTVILSESEAIVGRPISTHTMPLTLFANYIEGETGAKVMLLGIQPNRADLESPMSEQVRRTVEELEAALVELLRSL